MPEKILDAGFPLFKELKDAGFPQKDMPAYDVEGYIHRTHEEKAAWVYEPTLEELIEAIGTNFDVLKLTDSGWYAASNKTDFPQGNRIEVAGWRTPLIACAKLYIALSK